MSTEPKEDTKPAPAKSGLTVDTSFAQPDEGTSSIDLGNLDEGLEEPEVNEDPEQSSDEKPAEASTEEVPADPEALPDFDPDNEESVKQYDERYFTEGGTLNKDVLSAEFWKSVDRAGGDVAKGGLNEGTYKYLEKHLGISRDMAKLVEAGEVARQANEQAAYLSEKVGLSRWNAAIRWAKDEKGYSEEQQARFRVAYNKGGEDRDDAVDALLARFDKAKPRRDMGERRGPPQRRNSRPERDATRNAGQGTGRGVDAYPDGTPLSTYKADTENLLRERNAAKANADTPEGREALKALNKKRDDLVAKARRSKFSQQ